MICPRQDLVICASRIRPPARTRARAGVVLRRSRRGAFAAAAAGAVLTLCGLAAPAAAHDELTGTTPADGASVDVPPAAVELTFTEPPLALGSQVQVTGPDGEVVNAGDPQIVDTVVSQPLASGLPAGDYTIAWRVTSSDGHPISGELAFTATAGAAEPEESATPEPEPTGGATAAPVPTPDTPTPDTTPDTAASTAASPDAGASAERPSNGATPWIVGLVIVALVGGALGWTTRRRGTPGPSA